MVFVNLFILLRGRERATPETPTDESREARRRRRDEKVSRKCTMAIAYIANTMHNGALTIVTINGLGPGGRVFSMRWTTRLEIRDTQAQAQRRMRAHR